MNFMFWQSIMFGLYAILSAILAKTGVSKNKEILRKFIEKVKRILNGKFSFVNQSNVAYEEIDHSIFNAENENFYTLRIKD